MPLKIDKTPGDLGEVIPSEEGEIPLFGYRERPNRR